MSEESLVGVVTNASLTRYPELPPFSPIDPPPEYPFGADTVAGPSSPEDGRVYETVRRVFAAMRLDAENFGTPRWNPLGALIRPGETVVLKPNMVMHRHGWGWDLRCVVTHGSVVRAVCDYVCIALGGRGRTIIGDAPLHEADFAEVARATGIASVVKFYKAQGLDIDLVDFRKVRSAYDIDGAMTPHESLDGDPRGSTPVDLAERSWLSPLAPAYERYRVTNYDPGEMSKHHNLKVNEYLIANSILQADVVINIPKMKTHRKVGVTSALKNLVGINGFKDWLPHHRQGSFEEGGDEYLRTDPLKAAWSRLLDRENATRGRVSRRAYYYPRRALGLIVKALRRDPFSEGSWYGNDTAWRMVLDLNSILMYAGKTGEIRDSVQRKVFTVIDGIIAGEKEGPLEPSPKPAGTIIAGRSSVAVDAVVARLMGFDYRKIPLIRQGFHCARLPLISCAPGDIRVASDLDRWNRLHLTEGADSLGFEPPDGWKGHIELDAVAGAAVRAGISETSVS